MKQLINNLYYDARNSLLSMKKSHMTISERIKYENAIIQLNMMKQIIDQIKHDQPATF